MITTEQLDSLSDFGKEIDGSYCDRWQFSIVPVSFVHHDEWNFCLFNETDGDIRFVKKLKDFDDLKRVYEAITDSKLAVK